MSFHGLVETSDRSACVTSDPSGSRRSSRRCAESTTSSRPSGRKSMHIGKDATVAITSWLPSVPSAITWFAPQSENQSRPSCQRGDSPNTTPSSRTSAAPTLSLLLAGALVRQTAPSFGTHRTPSAPPRPLLSLLLRRHLGRPARTPGPARGANSTAYWASRCARSEKYSKPGTTRTAKQRAPALQRVPNIQFWNAAAPERGTVDGG